MLCVKTLGSRHIILTLIAFSIILIGFSLFPVNQSYSQIIEPIAITTDKDSYTKGEIIHVSGEVKDLLSGYQISLQIFEPSAGNQVAIQQFGVGPDKKFSTEIEAGVGELWRVDGTYTIKVLYGSQSRTAETTFEFSGSGVPLPKPTKVSVSVNVAQFYAYPGDSISIFGTVSGLDSFSRVRINISDPNGNPLLSQDTSTDYNGRYNTSVVLPRHLSNPGKYIVTADVGTTVTSSNTASFELRVKEQPQSSDSIHVETDKSSYKRSDIVVISGKVNNPQDYDVIVRVTNPRDIPVYQQNLGLKSDGSFGDMLIAGDGSRWIAGTFTVKATHDDRSTTSTFRFIEPTPQPNATPIPSPSPSSVEVRNAPGSSVPGCEETNECFIPGVVNIAIGGMVTWVNDDTAAHTSTSGSAAEGPDGNWDSSLVMVGQSFSHTFDEAGEFPYFCMVHPWMTGMVIVGEGGPIPPPPTPSPRISISVNADQAVYDLGDIVNLRVKISGTTSAQNVGVSVSDPTGKAVVSRTLATDRNGNADFDFGIHEDFKTGTYRVAVTSSIGGVTYKDATHFKIQSQFNQIRIVSVEGTDQQGNPAPFTRDQMGFVKVVVNANKPIASLITVNLFDSELTTIGIASFRTTLSTGETEVILSFMIPDDAATGAADIFTNAFSDWPSSGGVPLTGEFSANVRIT